MGRSYVHSSRATMKSANRVRDPRPDAEPVAGRKGLADPIDIQRGRARQDHDPLLMVEEVFDRRGQPSAQDLLDAPSGAARQRLDLLAHRGCGRRWAEPPALGAHAVWPPHPVIGSSTYWARSRLIGKVRGDAGGGD